MEVFKDKIILTVSGHRHTGLCHRLDNGINYFSVPSINSYPMRYTVFGLRGNAVFWKTPWVNVGEQYHVLSREKLLGDKFWRNHPYQKRSPENDRSVLEYFENNSFQVGNVGQ